MAKNDYQDNETLITFGDEGQTLRKDDPRTKEYIDRKKKEIENRSIFEGINLSNKREESENYEDYRNRLKINKQLNKIYQKLGRDKCWEQYPNGFKSVIDAIQEQSQNPPLTATMTTEDGKSIPVTIKNTEDAPTV
jgi:hypothetical protein|tara:strand:+ start:1552 stop:1959 length:408 start_codon:yes stop_codon:yes gene_type:complete